MTLSPSPKPQAPRPRTAAFTLLEMIISVALVLVLMLAVSKIFSITGAAVGASQGISAATRDARAAQTVFSQDIGAMANDSPFVIISSNPWPAFRNKQEQQADKDGSPMTIDLNGDGTEGDPLVPGEIVYPLTANAQEHRQDIFTFCARDRYYRQTGNNGTLVANMSAPEAMIWYGQLSIAGSNGKPNLPGDSSPSNTNNLFASQWILGRTSILMVEPDVLGTGGIIKDSNGTSQDFNYRTTNTTLQPLATGTRYTVKGQGPAGTSRYESTTQPTIQTSRYDLAGISIQTFRQNLSNILKTTPNYVWWTQLNTNPNSTRFQANPLLTKPIDAYSASQQVPLFVPGCSQFIVEYAGDFIAQDQYGNPEYSTIASPSGNKFLPLAPDGEVDFDFDPNTGKKSIQWYGAARWTSGKRDLSGNPDVSPDNGDVVPLSYFLNFVAGRVVSPNGAGYQSTANSNMKQTLVAYSDLVDVGLASFEKYNNAQALGTLLTNPITPYYAAWGPDSGAGTNIPRPKMYRITLVIDRPEMAGRLADGQTFEYIFNAP